MPLSKSQKASPKERMARMVKNKVHGLKAKKELKTLRVMSLQQKGEKVHLMKEKLPKKMPSERL
jgi:hypothetical protein